MTSYWQLTGQQALAQAGLSEAIRQAVDTGLQVPCQSDPSRWDDPSGPLTLCDGCPVLDSCAAYADTGAVEHGVMAGRHLTPSRARGGARTAAEQAA
jgi:hypothetical protein